jgi:MFS family permease
METELGASRVAITGAFSAGLLVAAALAIPVGRWIDRRGARGLMTAGSVLGSVLVLAWARVASLPALYAVWLLMGIALAATLYEPAFAAVVSWFTRHRDRALLIVTLTAGLASTIFVPLATWLLVRQGWRPALVTLAIILAISTIPIHALVLRRPPPGSDLPAGVAAAPGLGLRAALRAPVFWVLTGAFLVGNFATVSVTVHLIPYLTERGYSLQSAGVALGWVGATQLAGRIVFAPIARHVGHAWLTAAIFVVQAGGIVLLAALARAPVPALPLVVLMLGAANGMATLARATLAAEMFGRESYGAIAGALSVGTTTARALGPVGASLLRVWLGGYEPVFWLLGAVLVVAALAVGASARRTPDLQRG